MKSNKPRTATRKKAGAPRQEPQMPSGLHQQIAQRAYEIYERRIRQGALDDWLQAEREIQKLRIVVATLGSSRSN
jgi:hypothetical protein